jgi:VIT1/CCC1 family predicted Fe2+/Mn2+ transporter
VRAMLIGALGCNLAWGVIDGVLYLMGALAEKGRDLATLRAVRAADGPAARALVVDALPPVIAGVLQPAELDAVGARLQRQPDPASPPRLDADDWKGGLGVFLLVFLSTFPVAVPFIVMQRVGPALRVSNAIAIGLLFLTGYAFGRAAGRGPWRTGLAMVALGTALVALTMALGG